MQEEIKETIESKSIRKLGNGLIISIVLISVLGGAISGFAGGVFASKSKLFGLNSKIAGVVSDNTDNKASTEQKQENTQTLPNTVDVIKKASAAVVSVIISEDVNKYNSFSSPFFFDPFFQNQQQQNTTPQYKETGAGSGFFVSSDGLIMTNKHVVASTTAKFTVVTSNGKRYDATVLAQDPLSDLAIIKISIKGASYLKLSDSSKIQIGQKVIAIGNSLGEYSNTVTTGIISGIGRTITAGGSGTSETLEGVIQTDAAINPGNSGGPLLNENGDVIGMNTAMAQQGQSVGFAIPSNDISKALQSYKKYGRIVKAFLGIRYALINAQIQQQNNLPVDRGAWIITGTDEYGSPVSGVTPGSSADKAGLKDGDIITGVNGVKIDDTHSLSGLIRQYNPGDTVTLDVIRDKQNMKIKVVLSESK
ncbi:MAG: S1C family serine protease [Candidatus Doudnabacteria bacterium]